MRVEAKSVRSRGILRAVLSGPEADDPQALHLFSMTCEASNENKGDGAADLDAVLIFINSLQISH
jgi:hypothetical protein